MPNVWMSVQFKQIYIKLPLIKCLTLPVDWPVGECH